MPPIRPTIRLLLLLLWPLAAAAGPTVSGPLRTAFDWTADRCAPWDIPDSPARAWRDTGGVTLLAGSERTRLGRGPTLDDLRRDCRVVHQGAENDDPAAFDDRSWIASPYREPSGRLIALAHVEYHAHRRPGRCVAGRYAACWWNSLVELWGPDFTPRPHSTSLVAALPTAQAPGQTRRQGYFNPSNIIRRGDFLHAFIFAEDAPPQRRGACLIRRPVGGGPGDWRAWDGAGFGATFADPYRDAPADPARHVCAPLDGITSTISSVVRRQGTGPYLAVTPATLRDADGVLRPGVWWMTSDDLIGWSRPRLLLAVPLLWRRDCGADAAFAYPSLLDPDSPSANFETVDAEFRLYLVRIHLDADCRAGPRRDLVHAAVSWPAPPAGRTAPPAARQAPADRADPGR